MANITSYVRRYTGTAVSAGVTPVAVTISAPLVPPPKGWMFRVAAEITAGPGTKVRVTIREDGPVGNIIAIYDDPANLGDGELAPWNFNDPRLWYERGAVGLFTAVVEVPDDATDATSVLVTIDLGGV